MIVKTNVLLVFILNFLYVFRSIAVVFRIEKLIYVVSVILILINLLYALLSARKLYINAVSVFMLIGGITLLYSMLVNPPVIGFIGFSVIYLNLLLWYSISRVIRGQKLTFLFSKLIELNVYFGCVTAMLGLYQYFLDSSIMGLALHDVYGNPEFMASGQFVKRVTGLMGSPQNYSLYIAVTTSLVSYVSGSKKNKMFMYIILVLGGLVSGSRAYTVFIVIVILLNYIFDLVLNSQTRNNILKRMMIVFGVGGLVGWPILTLDFSNNTISRMLNVINDWPALNIYKYHLSTMGAVSIWLGKGLGVNERIVVQLLGGKYYELVGGYVDSYESYLLSIFMQMGLVGILAFMSVYIKSILKVYNAKEAQYLSMLVAIFINIIVTPSFNGLAMSFIVWPLILYPMSIKKDLFIEAHK